MAIIIKNKKPMRPMLAPNDKTILENILWPKLGSFKLDGVRAVVWEGELVSRTRKLIPNLYTRSLFGRREYNNFDGELIVGDPFGEGVINRTVSGVMTITGEPNVHLHVFDYIKQDIPFLNRFSEATSRVDYIEGIPITTVRYVLLNNLEDMLEFEKKALDAGYEGIMLRDPDSNYKYGRATQKQNTLLKIKRFEDGEALILDVKEGMTNKNVVKKNVLGLTERQTLKDNETTSGGIRR